MNNPKKQTRPTKEKWKRIGESDKEFIYKVTTFTEEGEFYEDKRIPKSFLAQAKSEERELCRQIFIDEVYRDGWGTSDEEAAELFDEARSKLKQEER